MIVFHLLYDLAEFYSVPVNYDQGPVYYTGKTAATLFFMIAGASSSFSKNNLRRGAKILALGALVSVVTFVVFPGSNIFFGTLQLLGASIMLYPLFKNWRAPALAVLGTVIIITGRLFERVTLPNNWFAPFGLLGETFSSADYYPLFPWFGVFICGAALGKMLYKNKTSLFSARFMKNPLVVLGRHSLTVYLIHQPLLLALLFLFLRKPDKLAL
ncbi:MAG: DUF1624 domain-containing protein [Firmicutes bacterium]|nr:DUF1624 domain-containing protein [Bacillota bacterium]